MTDVRESSFHCLFDSTSVRRSAQVRAWDAKEALQLFVVELAAEGIEDEGDVVVSPAGGGAPWKAHVPRRHAA
jgi:hypothetical protein